MLAGLCRAAAVLLDWHGMQRLLECLVVDVGLRSGCRQQSMTADGECWPGLLGAVLGLSALTTSGQGIEPTCEQRC